MPNTPTHPHEEVCGGCGRVYETQSKLTGHQQRSHCITEWLDITRSEVAAVVDEADTLLEVQDALNLQRERARLLVSAYDLDDEFRCRSPEALINHVGLEVGESA